VVYSRDIDGRTLTFGVSGRLYKSNVLIYDHQTDSLWSQLKETAIAGPMVGSKLNKISAKRISWKRWVADHPSTKVLSTDTGYTRNYAVDPYQGYYKAMGIMFPVGDVRTDLPAKEMVLGIEIGGMAKAYPLSHLASGGTRIGDTIGGQRIHIVTSKDGQVVDVLDDQSQSVTAIFAYWFAWQAFHPQTAVFTGNN
jgi:hypothetical protein